MSGPSEHDPFRGGDPGSSLDPLELVPRGDAELLSAARADAERRAAQQALVARLGHRALAGADVGELIGLAARAVCEGLSAGYGGVSELTAEGDFVARALEGFSASLVGRTVSTMAEEGHSWFTMHTGQPVVVADYEQETRFRPGAVLREQGIRSGLTVPIFLGPGKPYGLLSALSSRPYAFERERVDFVASIANILGESLARRHEAERLRASEETLRLATEAASLGLWDWDPVSGALSWSPRTRQIYGLSPDEPVSFERYHSLLHPADRQRMQAVVSEAMGGKDGGRFRSEHRVVRPDGAERWLQAHGRVIFGKGGEPVRVLGTTADVTEQKAAEQAAREASRAKDEFLAMLGHELRNPLAPIVTATQLMKMRGGEAHAREREVIERQVRHLSRLVDDLLDVSRIAAGRVQLEIEAVSIDEVVARAIETASPLIEERRHRLAVSSEPSLFVRGDATRLAQVLSNLLTNSAKYTPAAGHIDVTARREGEQIVLSVRDDGMGIRPELLPRVFDLFAQGKQSLDRAHGGLGLGLAIVKSLIGMHHGSVEARSEGEGKGTEIVVRLPALSPARAGAGAGRPVEAALGANGAAGAAGAAGANGATSAASGATGAASGAGGARVLLVDDNADAVELLSMALSARGFVVATAEDGPSALSLLERFSPDVAVLDVGLPVMDGFELASRLRRTPGLEALPLVAVTGYGQQRDRERSKAAGFDAHLVKPVDLDELRRALVSLVEARKEPAGR